MQKYWLVSLPPQIWSPDYLLAVKRRADETELGGTMIAEDAAYDWSFRLFSGSSGCLCLFLDGFSTRLRTLPLLCF
jgi:hypothetical protein